MLFRFHSTDEENIISQANNNKENIISQAIENETARLYQVSELRQELLDSITS
jgi:hypothetical protein